ncbi:MAG: hypothetical protein H0T99_10505 [Geodermatophilaceae bacterium]|nr:hypothetical protein [Geodermatophilaceae bacterium]MDQ3476677.1 hypothetical protein [Actinomycetota bacterium]
MPQSQLRTDLLGLAERDEVAVDGVLVADVSRRTTRLRLRLRLLCTRAFTCDRHSTMTGTAQ